MNKSVTISLSVVVICEVFFIILGRPMEEQGFNILDQEFAWNAKRANEIFNAWEPIKQYVFLFMLVDMIFPAALFALNYSLHSYVETGFETWKRISLFGMIADYLENLLTFVMLFGIINDGIAFTLSLFATVKFLAVIPALLFGLFRAIKKTRLLGFEPRN
ncbi:MAG: hypothetical protein D6732_22840 [Methanobacteriota archaeon]|nr:MAG: hypothetical protein D6732_22840 [Euryarchaeota archaeon]